MKKTFRNLTRASAVFLALAPWAAFADSTLVTHLFPRTNGEADANTGANRDEWLEVGKEGSIAWITYVTGGADLSLTVGSSLTLYVDSVHSGGWLKVFALDTPLAAPELDVEAEDLDFNPAEPIDSVEIGAGDQEKVVRLNLGNLLAVGAFHGLVLKGYDGLRADFGAKDAPVQPLIELKHAFAAPSQISAAIAAGASAQVAAEDAANAAAAADASAVAAAGSATAAAASATAASASATAASSSASAASASATSAAGSAASAGSSAAAASGSASSAASSATAAASSAAASAASASAAEAAVPYGIGMLGLDYTPPSGFVNTGIKINYEVPAPWTSGSGLSSARHNTGYAVIGNKIYVAGGHTGSSIINTLAEYDASTNSWTTLATMPFNAHLNTLVAYNGLLYTIGGLTTTSGGVINELHKYNPSTNSWSALADAPFGRWAHAAAAVDGKIYVMGGYTTFSQANTTTTVHCYDIATNTWSTKAALPTARAYTAAIALNGKIHVLGGYTGSSYVDSHEIYNPSTNAWSSASALPSPRSDMRLAAVNNRIYVLGGDNGSSLGSALQYDADLNSWSTLSSMSTSRAAFAIGAIGETIYALGGYSRTSGTLSTTEKYAVPKAFYLIIKNP